jgi:hypothetical protein
MIEAMKKALEALEWRFSNADAAIEALRQAIEQAEKQEPVDIHCPSCLHSFAVVPVAKREWVGLDDDDFEYQPPQTVFTMKFAEAILRDRNK